MLWAAGVQASPLARSLGAPLDRAGRVEVEPDLSLPGHPNVFVAGDLAARPARRRPDGAGRRAGGHPDGQARRAPSVAQLVAGEPTRPFRYRDKGSLATIGRAAAVGEIGRVRLSGFLAWMAWLLIHIFYLIGFRNRLWVLAGGRGRT